MHTVLSIVHAIALLFFNHGAKHVTHGSSWIATKHYAVFVCHIPATFVHGTFHCTGWIRR